MPTASFAASGANVASGEKTSHCSVRVRLLEATTGAQPEARSAKFVEPKLEEEGVQLAALPFERFSVLAEATQDVFSGQTTDLSLFVRGHGTHHFTLEPQLIATTGKVDVVFHWSGPDGEELLSTKLQIDNGKHIVLGSGDEEDELVEPDHKEGTVVCVKVKCE